MTFSSLNAAVGAVISESPYVKLLSKPTQRENGQWTALAQVNGSLCVIAVDVTPVKGA